MLERLRLSRGLLRPLAGALLVCFALAFAAPLALAAEPTIAYTKESIGQYEKQLAAGEIKQVTVNKFLRSLRVTLNNGQHVLAKYAKKQESKYAAALAGKHVPTTFLSPPQAKAQKGTVHHKLRYIAAAVLVAVLIIVGLVLFVNRRRKAVLD